MYGAEVHNKAIERVLQAQEAEQKEKKQRYDVQEGLERRAIVSELCWDMKQMKHNIDNVECWREQVKLNAEKEKSIV
jgi:hypothetical protein